LTTGSEATAASPLDRLKWLVVVAIVAGGIFGNWYYGTEPLLFRVLGLVALAALAVFVAGQTERGRSIWTLMKEARGEIRRVIWPKREETVQTTVIVLILVLIFALILWLLDSGLTWIVARVIG
jgi:preprotein translocase subunit SecE